MSFINDYLIFLSGIVCGIILLQASVIAPTLFAVFEVENAGLFLRKVFPKFFLLIMFFSSLMLILVGIADNLGMSSFVLPFVNLIFSGVSYLVIPATNRSRDAGEENKFKALHSLTVVLTILILLLNIFWWWFA